MDDGEVSCQEINDRRWLDSLKGMCTESTGPEGAQAKRTSKREAYQAMPANHAITSWSPRSGKESMV